LSTPYRNFSLSLSLSLDLSLFFFLLRLTGLSLGQVTGCEGVSAALAFGADHVGLVASCHCGEGVANGLEGAPGLLPLVNQLRDPQRIHPTPVSGLQGLPDHVPA
jgi:hypothetical protein